MSEGKSTSTIWGARFQAMPHELMEIMNASISFDKRLYKQDIQGSLAHVKMLAQQGIIPKSDEESIKNGLKQIHKQIEDGSFSFTAALEDIHMNIESKLTVLIGDAGGKLHTARSRNDQVSTDLRIWTRNQTHITIDQIKSLIIELVKKADNYSHSIMPGFTHLQNAQPVTFGHHLMAYVEMFARDISRFQDANVRINECPLGSAALAGTSFNIDRDFTSDQLGFDRPMANSMDAVSDRDFVLEFLSCSAICSTHLSRLAEELVLWSSAQFGFVSLGDEFSTGSSIMPQKRNPDAAELVRAKTGRIAGSLIALLTVLKGLPLAYSKDLQEDKEQLFDAADMLQLCILAMTGMINNLSANTCNMKMAAKLGHSTATDMADWLVRVCNVPFRDAHHITGNIVRAAEQKGCDLSDLELEELQAVYQGFREDVYNVLTPENSASSRTSYGGTAPVRVTEQINIWKKRLQDDF